MAGQVKYPEIKIDHSKCLTPFDCKKCLRICPQAVFEVFPVKVERFKETDKKEPGSYRLQGFYRDKCTLCNKCVEICPVNAITIVLPND